MEILLGEMLAGIKTPLSFILQNISSIGDNEAPISQVEESCFEMLGVINDTIDFLNLLTNRLQLVRETCDCEKLVTEAFGFVEKSIKEKNIQWNIRIDKKDKGVPPSVISDYNRIQQILVYFIRTAVMHMNNGAVVAEIGTQGDYYIFSIQDTGNGLSEATQTHMDEILRQRAPKTPPSYDLLGFAVCHFLCQLMGGDIRYTTAPDLGTKFWFRVRQGN